MAEEYVNYAVCDERCKRLDEEDKRHNERLNHLEASLGEINRLAISLERLTATIEQLIDDLKAQGIKISKLESRDGEKWRGVVKISATAVISAIIGAVLVMFGLNV